MILNRYIIKSILSNFFMIVGLYSMINYTIQNKYNTNVTKSLAKNKTIKLTTKFNRKKALDVVFEEESLMQIKNSKFLFIGGFPRSGTTLLRAIMDVHESVSCGPDPHYLSKFLNYFSYLNENVHNDDVNRLFLDYVLRNHFNSIHLGYSVSHIPEKIYKKNTILCLKSRSLFLHFKYVYHLFPKSKIIYLVRDGRDIAFSIIKNLNLARNNENFLKILTLWNDLNEKAYHECKIIGMKNCIIIKYENLVKQTSKYVKIILKCLDLKYMRDLLHHDHFINKRIFLEKDDWSSKKVAKKIDYFHINQWVGKVNYNKSYVYQSIHMLKRFGYKIDFNNENDGVDHFTYINYSSKIISYDELKRILI